MKHFFNGLLAFAGIALLLIFDKEQRELYNRSIGYGDDTED
ncbi:MAG: hypothetical protein PUC15_08180 [Lentisphaeria bacterium]|nr:hypothetical protein [Lentisphaeria bacterium]